jgi:hypothetical protein
MSDNQPTVPGLGPTWSPGWVGPIEKAARDLLQALDDTELLGRAQELNRQMVLSLSAALDRGLIAGKVSVATTTLARQLLEWTERLPSPDDVDQVDELAAALGALTA